jgi:hypothetical protein
VNCASTCRAFVGTRGAYLAELKTSCSSRDSDFQQRSKMRSDETKAIEQAIQVMKEKAALGLVG